MVEDMVWEWKCTDLGNGILTSKGREDGPGTEMLYKGFMIFSLKLVHEVFCSHHIND